MFPINTNQVAERFILLIIISPIYIALHKLHMYAYLNIVTS